MICLIDMTKIAPTQPTVAAAALSHDIVKAPPDRYLISQERRQRLDIACNEMATNGRDSRLAAEK
jgi:hypothetical protein